MDQGPLVIEATKAGEELVHLLDQSFPVKAAFWLKDGEELRWYLYITSDQLNDANLDVGYREVLRIAYEIANPFFDPFQVKLIPTSHPLAQAALEIHRKYPLKMAARLGGTNFGGMGVEDVYLYPASLTALTT